MKTVFYTDPKLYEKIQEEEYIPLVKKMKNPEIKTLFMKV